MSQPDLAKLREPFPPERISWRVGSTTANKDRGMALAYIDARDVQDRLDAVCGPENWQCRYPHANGKTVCEIGIRVGDDWVWKADGAGDTDFEAEKGALSDAFKRAAVRWGIGRYLYDVDAPWVAIEGSGKSYKIKESELHRLQALLAGRKPAPANAAPPADDKRMKAVEWANASIASVRQMGPKDFDAWHKANREIVARVKEYDVAIHAKLVEAIRAKLDAFNPIGA